VLCPLQMPSGTFYRVALVGPDVSDNISPPSSGFHGGDRIPQLCYHLQALLAICFALDSYLDYSSALKMDTICSSETLVDSTEYAVLYPRSLNLF
jgi:hypothetical protein